MKILGAGDRVPYPLRDGANVALALLVATGLALRVWNLSAGLPHFPHPDEPTHLGVAVRAGIGGLNPHFFGYPTVWPYLLLSGFAAFFAAGRVVGRFGSLEDFEALYFTDPMPFFLLGRAMTAVLGSASIVLVYWLGRELATRRAAVIAAAIIAVAPLHVYYSRYMVNDTALAFALVGAMLLVVRSARTRSRAAETLAAVATGLAISVKYSAAPLVAPLLGAVLVRAWPIEGRVSVVRAMAKGLAWVVVGFVVGTPFALLAPREFATGLAWPVTYAWVGDPAFDLVGNSLVHLLVAALPHGVGVLVAVLAVSGFVLVTVDAVRHRVVPPLLAAGFVAPYMVIVGSSATPFVRYLLPVLPFAAVYAATLVDRLVGAFPLRPRWQAAVTVVALTLLIAEPLGDSLRWLASISRPDTRWLAREWLERHAAPGDVIVTEPYGPPMEKSRDQWRSDIESLRALASHDAEARRQLDRTERKYRVVSRLPAPGPTFTVYVLNLVAAPGGTVGVFDVPYSMDAVHGKGAAYVVLSSIAERMRRDPRRYVDAVRFYDELERQARPLVTLSPFGTDCHASVSALREPVLEALDPRCKRFNGPSLTIYALDQGRRP